MAQRFLKGSMDLRISKVLILPSENPNIKQSTENAEVKKSENSILYID
jgi:hypothetical protein